MENFNVKIRSDFHNHWLLAQLAIPAKGKLVKGEMGISIITDDSSGTGDGNIVEVVGKIGAFDTPTPFNDCPIVFRTPGSKIMETKEAIFNEEIDVTKTNAYKDVIVFEEETGGGGEEGGGEEIENGEAPEFNGQLSFQVTQENPDAV